MPASPWRSGCGSGPVAHGHAHDDHRDHADGKERRLGIVAALTGSFMLAEAVGGVLSGSLALLADAGHMLTDFASLVLAWFAARVARRPADWQRTYGFDRFSVWRLSSTASRFSPSRSGSPSRRSRACWSRCQWPGR